MTRTNEMVRTMEISRRLTEITNNGTPEEKRRAELCYQYLANEKDPGRFGRIEELLSARSKSRKNAVGRYGENDNYIKVDGKYIACECKTNGGRIANLYTPKAPRFIIYTLDLTITHKDGTTERRQAKKVIETGLFLLFLSRYKLIKSTNGKNPEPAIQCSSKKLYTALLNYPIDYIKDYDYTETDFHCLTLDI